MGKDKEIENNETGIASLEEIEASPGYPSQERLENGTVAVIECIQEIPCNPCESACRFGAIAVGRPITNLPKLIGEKCRGCGECIPACPGLAIFLVNRNYSAGEATVSVPYEYLPLPEVGSVVDALNRGGKSVCSGRVIRIANPERNNGTVVVTMAIPRNWSDQVRSFRIVGNIKEV